MIQADLEVEPISVAGQQTHHGQVFPLALECRSPGVSLAAACDWLREQSRELLVQASEHGAVLFRGFLLVTPEDFDAFVAAFELRNFRYEESLSNAVRIVKTPRVFTANEAPPHVNIYFHHEMAQTPIYPSRLFF